MHIVCDAIDVHHLSYKSTKTFFFFFKLSPISKYKKLLAFT